MKNRLLVIILIMTFILSLFSTFPASAAVVETVTVPVTVTSSYKGVNDWANATFTCILTNGVPAPYGTLSNGVYSFMYKPSTGEIKKEVQTDIGFSFVGATTSTVVIPWRIDAFSVSSAEYTNNGAAVTTSYQQKTITFSSSVYVYTFNNLSDDVQEIGISEGIEVISPKTFYGIPTTNKTLRIVLPTTLKTIDNGAFWAATLGGAIYNEIIIPSGVTTINNNAFAITRFTDCTFPAGVSVVTASVLQNNNKLVNMTFKGSITSFGNSAFSGCSALRNMTFEGKTAPTTFGTSVFNSVTKLNVFYPANGTGYDTEAFKNAFPTGTTFTPVASKPVATGLSISGKGLVGNTLQGSYSTFTGAGTSIETGSTATWRRADDSAFTTNATT
ncbi:MAG: leucine-rich repeat domain-containing protein, partial [Eubacteriales bacterium]|nr:leucine-rich repeat domain-containing protein [Eubacteriales bacterium]